MSKSFENAGGEIREPNQDEVTGQVLTPEEVEDERVRREQEGWREQK